MKRLMYLLLFSGILFASMVPMVSMRFDLSDESASLEWYSAAYYEGEIPVSDSGEYELSVIYEGETVFSTMFDRPLSQICYDYADWGECEEQYVDFNVIVPLYSHSQIVQITHGNLVLFSSPLSPYLCNMDGNCSGKENSLSCPEDCPTGSADNFCDRQEDGICDPDCAPIADLDCDSEEKAGRTLEEIYVQVNVTEEEMETFVESGEPPEDWENVVFPYGSPSSTEKLEIEPMPIDYVGSPMEALGLPKELDFLCSTWFIALVVLAIIASLAWQIYKRARRR